MSRRRHSSNSFDLVLVKIALGVLGVFLGFYFVIMPTVQRMMHHGQ